MNFMRLARGRMMIEMMLKTGWKLAWMTLLDFDHECPAKNLGASVFFLTPILPKNPAM
jgi:hypothetical protein